MVNAQEWLNRNFPLESRRNIRNLLVCSESYINDRLHRQLINPSYTNKYYLTTDQSLTGTLDLSSFPKLKKLIIKKQFINRLILRDCSSLKELWVRENLLKEITLPTRTDKLEGIDLSNNNFDIQDLSIFASYVNLIRLHIGTDIERRINFGIYNRFYGSFFPIRNLTKLEELDINSTNIDSGIEYLPAENLYLFTCGDAGRTGAKVNRIKEILELDEEEAVDTDENENSFKLGKIDEVQREIRERLENQVEVSA